MVQADYRSMDMLKRAARAATMAAAGDPAGQPDPIFQLIEQHSSDQRELEAFLAENPDRQCSKNEERVRCETVQASLHELIETPPRTLVGALAVLAHIRNSNAHGVMWQDEWLEFLASLESGLQGIAGFTQTRTLHD
jgi:hypothetical protein